MLQRKQLNLAFLDLTAGETQENDILVMLHGYGSNEKDLIQLAPLLDREMRFISVRAPERLDREMYGWFPLEFTPQGVTADREAVREAGKTLAVFLRGVLETYNPRGGKLWLMGFSQGAIMSYLMALAEPSLLHGIIALSGQFPEPALQAAPDPQAFRALPFLVVHGLYDDVLPVTNGRFAEQWLTGKIDDLTYREYPVGHSIHPDAPAVLDEWLTSRRRAT